MSCRDVCMTADYDGSVEFYHDAIRRAAKEHRCCECNTVIAMGQQYEYVSGKWDGRFDTFKTCLVCLEIRQEFYCGGWMLGQLWEDVSERIFPSWNEMTAIDCLARLTTDEAINKMRAEFGQWHDGGLPSWMPAPAGSVSDTAKKEGDAGGAQ